MYKLPDNPTDFDFFERDLNRLVLCSNQVVDMAHQLTICFLTHNFDLNPLKVNVEKVMENVYLLKHLVSAFKDYPFEVSENENE